MDFYYLEIDNTSNTPVSLRHWRDKHEIIEDIPLFTADNILRDTGVVLWI